MSVTVSGEWGAGCQSEARPGRHARYYVFAVGQEQDEKVTISLESAIGAYLYLRDGEGDSGRIVQENDDINLDSGNYNSEIQATLPSGGTYTIEATTHDAGQEGSFTLTVNFATATTPPPGDECEETLTADGAVPGEWAPGCESETPAPGSGSGARLARFYAFELEHQSEVTITLERTSGNADTYLYLWAGSQRTGAPEAFDDDSPDTSRSRITKSLDTGAYTVEATTYEAGQNGRFTLTVEGLGATGPSPSGPDRAVLKTLYNATGGPNWTNNSGWLSDNPTSQWHGVTTDGGGRVVALGLSENQLVGEIPPRLANLMMLQELRLRGNQLSGEIPAELGDLGNLEIIYLAGNPLTGCVPAGLEDVPDNDFDQLGLNFCDAGPPSAGDDCIQVLDADSTVSGQWAADVDCESEARSGSHARYFKFTLAQESEVAITLARASDDDPDPYLYLRRGHGRTGTILNNHEQDDDAAGGRNSQVVETLAAGDYTIEATTYDPGQVGNFTLSVEGL